MLLLLRLLLYLLLREVLLLPLHRRRRRSGTLLHETLLLPRDFAEACQTDCLLAASVALQIVLAEALPKDSKLVASGQSAVVETPMGCSE